MPLPEPAWWYHTDGGWSPRLLHPVSRIWGWTAARRVFRSTPERASLPVICIGNFTSGGTGKTPLSILIARHLSATGERPVILTRGYGGRRRGPHRVNPSLDTAVDVGDEALLLARHAPVIVARDRPAGARLAAADIGLTPPTVIVMDDGLQNPSLAKDLTIAVVDGLRGLGNRQVIPAGPLRAPLDVQFGLADAVLINAAPGSDAARVHQVVEEFRTTFHGPVLEARVEPDAGELEISGVRVLALAGIANPARFYTLLGNLGAEIVGRAQFSDHHAFTDSEASMVLADAKRLAARIVTTEKDLVRLAGFPGARSRLREAATALPIRLKLEPRDELRLASLIDSAIVERRKQGLKP